jgi:hypothetical protein
VCVDGLVLGSSDARFGNELREFVVSLGRVGHPPFNRERKW